MNTVVQNQQEWDALPPSYADYTVIEIRTTGTVAIRTVPGSSHVVAKGSSHVVATGSSSVEAWESSHVVARGSSSVEAMGSSHVVARESSHVVARESSSVEAMGSSHVEAWESSSVEAWESSRVEAWGQTTTHHRSNIAPELHGQAVCFRYPKTPTPKKKSDDCIVIKAEIRKGVDGWLKREGIVEVDGAVILYKRVSAKLQTQEGTSNETTWTIGTSLTHPGWEPKSGECGEGKFHACSRTYFCDEFRNSADDVYVAIRIAVADLHAWDEPHYPHKIAFRAGDVLYRVDKWGG